jgi:ribosome-associated protein
MERVDADGLRAGSSLVIPIKEIELKRSRSGGPGGQNVNKVETQVEARWDIAASAALTDTQRARLLAALAPRLVGGSVLVVKSRTERTQEGNRRAALNRLAALVAAALRPRKKRHATCPTKTSREKRLSSKKERSRVKRERARPIED